MNQTLFDALVDALNRAGSYNRNDQAAPAAVLWPDKDRLWEAIVPRLRGQLPLLSFGPYAPEKRTGPAYWLRCVIAGTLPEDQLPHGVTPIVYLPGVGKTDLRAVEECPRDLQPLAELQYRGVFWTHRNGREWTPLGFLQAADGGAGVPVAADTATREALQRALPRLLDEPLAQLRAAAPLRAEFFDGLLAPDPTRALLLWLDNPQAFRGRGDDNAWSAFVTQSQRSYNLNPEHDGQITAAERLGMRQGAWAQVWARYAEAPDSYRHIPDLLRRARPQQLAMFETQETWPQDNEAAERVLRERLHALESLHPPAARVEVAQLEREHEPRRNWVWARLGFSPLAVALAHINELATYTMLALSGTVAEQINAYTGHGWRADDAALQALACVEHPADVSAVSAALGAIYQPWLDQSARTFQAAYAPRPDGAELRETSVAPGTCFVFCDALRYDLAQRLREALAEAGVECSIDAAIGPFPGVTPTAKPAVSPVAARFTGTNTSELTPRVAARGTRATAEALRGELTEAGFQVLANSDGDPSGRGWTEIGAIDGHGHQHGWKLSHHVAGELRAIERRIVGLLAAGWQQVVVITDHGWLLLPAGLPKAELPEQLTSTRKERCARLKSGAATEQRTLPWFWNHDVQVAVPPGIACYEAGHQYAHGGLSLQECLIPQIRATRGGTGAQISRLEWRGLRCTVALVGATPDLKVDIRTRAADAAASLLLQPRVLGANGSVTLLIEDEDRIGDAAIVVVIDGNNAVISQQPTTIGGA